MDEKKGSADTCGSRTDCDCRGNWHHKQDCGTIYALG